MVIVSLCFITILPAVGLYYTDYGVSLYTKFYMRRMQQDDMICIKAIAKTEFQVTNVQQMSLKRAVS